MFKKKWFRPNTIESNEGFSVKVAGRTEITYIEDSKNMTVETEMLATPGISLFSDSIKAWNSPHDNETITAEKRDAIVDNICRAMDFYGWETDIIDRSSFRQKTGENS